MGGLVCAATVNTLLADDFGIGFGCDDIRPIHEIRIVTPPGVKDGTYSVQTHFVRDGLWAGTKNIAFTVSSGEVVSVTPKQMLAGDIYGGYAREGKLIADTSSLAGYSVGGSISDQHVYRHAASAQEFWSAWAQGTATVYEPFYIYIYRPCDAQATRTYDQKVLCDSPAPGMPRYNVHALAVSLNITDTPLAYEPAAGPGMMFTLVYNQRDASGSPPSPQTNFGSRWACHWLACVVDDPAQPSAPVQVQLAGGGSETYLFTEGQTESAHLQSGAHLEKISGGYERRLPDGSRELFELERAGDSSLRTHFLTRRIDRHGSTFALQYQELGGMRLQRIIDPLGGATSLEYGPDEPLKPVRVTDPFGRCAQFDYDSQGRLVGIIDQVGLSSRFAYDPAGFITGMTTPYGLTTFAAGENGSHRWLEITDPMGGRERVEFRDKAPGSSPSEPASPSGFGAANKQLDYHNTYFWDRLAMAEAPGDYSKARVIHWLENAGVVSGIIASRKSPMEGRIWYAYEGQVNPLSVGSSSKVTKLARLLDDGSTQLNQFQYDAEGNLLKSVDPLGRTHLFEYQQGNLTRMSQLRGGQPQTLRAFEYGANRLLTKELEANGATTSWSYNELGQPLLMTDALGASTAWTYFTEPGRTGLLKEIATGGRILAKYEYDRFQRVSASTDADGLTRRFEYDGGATPTTFDRVVSIGYPDGTSDQWSYNKLDADSFKDRLGRTTRYSFNARRQLSAWTDPLGRTTRLQWCACGSLESLIDPAGHTTAWRRDLQGRQLARTINGQLAETYAYEPVSGRLRSVTDAMGQTVQYSYFADNALQRISYIDALFPTAAVSFSYDAETGQLRGMNDGIGTTTYSYHPLNAPGAGSVSSIEGPLVAARIEYFYDLLGRLLKRRYAGMETSISYNAIGQVVGASSPLGASTYAYSGARLESATFGNGVQLQCSFSSPENSLKSLNFFRFGQPSFLKLDYKRNAGDLLISEKAGPNEVSEYGYDLAGQLLSVNWRSGETLHQYGFGYDPAGNRTSTQDGALLTTFSYNGLNQLTAARQGEGAMHFAGWVTQNAVVNINQQAAYKDGSRFSADVPMKSGTHRVQITATGSSGLVSAKSYEVVVSGSGERSYAYDLNGNMISNGVGQTYEWDAANRLTAINYAESDRRTELTYDGLGRRIRTLEKEGAKETRTDWIWDGLTVLEQRQGARRRIQFPEGFWEMEGTGGRAYYTLRDHLGSVRVILDENSAVCARYSYGPFGQRTAAENSLETNFGFTGHWYHAPSGLHLAPFRVYSDDLGRWLSRDPLGESQGPNLYAYANNDPINFVDPLGLRALMHCSRCKEDPTGPMKCHFSVNGRAGTEFMTNLGPNGASQTKGDLYGRGGPLPPGFYNILPKPSWQGAGYPAGQPSVSAAGQAAGVITTPAGTRRDGLRIHGPGLSLGCVTTPLAVNPYGGPSAMQNMMNTHGLDLQLDEVCCRDSF